MSNRFCPGRVDYEGTMARDFNAGRALSPYAQKVWRLALEPYLGRATRALDVGSGTGRFTVLLAQWFGATVIGIEPANGMRKIAAVDGRHSNASYVGGRAEELPFKASSFDVALLSNVYHHISDRSAGAEELCRVLRAGGRVLIRGAFAGRLGEITLFDYFPEAKVVCEQFPTLAETLENFSGLGFEFEAVSPVVQQTCSSLKEFAARTRLRADTTLIPAHGRRVLEPASGARNRSGARNATYPGHGHSRPVGVAKAQLTRACRCRPRTIALRSNNSKRVPDYCHDQ